METEKPNVLITSKLSLVSPRMLLVRVVEPEGGSLASGGRPWEDSFLGLFRFNPERQTKTSNTRKAIEAKRGWDLTIVSIQIHLKNKKDPFN